jgi:23S rRNA pseudouridine1911/1915/1917 synthase
MKEIPLLLLASIGYVRSFSIEQQTKRKCRGQGETHLAAKPPPKAVFDIAAIEAYEEQLNLQDTILADEFLEDLDEVILEDVRSYIVPDELHHKRLDAVICALEPDLSRSYCGNLITEKRVHLVHSEGIKELLDRKSFKAQKGAHLLIQFPDQEKPTEIQAEDLPLDILYEDEHMIVLNKAAHMVVHPAAGNWGGTVVNALCHYLSKVSAYGRGDFVDENGMLATNNRKDQIDGCDGENTVSFRPGIVHRLDKGTTGVLVVAKTTKALTTLSEAFATRKVRKTYLAITVGNPGQRVKIDKPIGRHPIHRQRMRVVPDPHRRDSGGMAPKDRLTYDKQSASMTGRHALSYVDTIAFDDKLALVQIRIETGRTHQIRVHLQDRHTPVYGDSVYGLTDWNKHLYKSHQIDRPLLHAYKLEIDHPITGVPMVFQAPLAEDMLHIAKSISPNGVLALSPADDNAVSVANL